ncbi:hypothetical protein [Escherichia coli]|uniref:hypothetical protein n=1 Tax=Escherichia coli TaxID=562 RepID=UPI002FCCDB1C
MERHIGQFNSPEEVKRYLSGRTGCIRVAALRVRDINPRGGLSGLVTWVAYIMATDSWGYSRDVRCEVLAGKVIKRLLSSDATGAWGLNAWLLMCGQTTFTPPASTGWASPCGR